MNKPHKSAKTLQQVFLITFIFFLFLLLSYFYNNKYTADGLQPSNGIITISEQELETNQVVYLVHGWQFYQGQLLSPSDFESGNEIPLSQTVAIGQYMDFSFGQSDRDTDGSGTYRLILSLPDTPHIYTLYLEKVFSAYHVYINGQLLHSVGVPESDSYREAITNSEISFAASGDTELIIAVTNQSHYYSGITFPPVFGPEHAVTRTLHIQLLICMAALTTIVICTVISLYYGLVCNSIRRRTLLYNLICLGLFISISYPIVFTLFTVKSGIWYPLELFSIYGVYLLSVLLMNDIRDIPFKKSLFICIPLFLFCAISVLYAVVPHHSRTINLAFQYGSRIVKLAVAAYLLYHAISAVLYDENYAPILMTGTAAAAVSIFTDRLLPLYEPIYGGGFTECGLFFLVLCFGVHITRSLTMDYKQQLIFQEERRLLTSQLAMQQMHYMELTDKIDNSIRYRHDERHRLNTISSLLESGEIEKLKQYLKEYNILNETEERTVLCTHLTVDAILQFYMRLCRQAEIEFIIEADIPSRIPVSDIDLSLLFSNLIENAYEACMDQEPDNPYIHVISRFRQDTLLLRIKNNITHRPEEIHNGLFKSTKHSGLGIGTQSVEAIVKNYDGQIKYDITDTTFQVSVVLPMKYQE